MDEKDERRILGIEEPNLGIPAGFVDPRTLGFTMLTKEQLKRASDMLAKESAGMTKEEIDAQIASI